MNAAIDFFKKLFDTSGFMPRWICGRWTEVHGWVYIISNIVIGLAYFAIPVMLFLFVRKTNNVPFRGIFILFSLFIIFCGLTHIIDANMFWFPLYRLNALLLFITAVISTITVIVLYKNLPAAFSLKSPAQLQKIIDEQTAALILTNQKLQQSEAQFKTLVNSNPDIITLMSADLRYKFVNDSLAAVSSRNLDNYIGKTPWDVLPEHPHTEAFTRQLKHVVETGEKVHYEVETITEKIGAACFSVDMIPIKDKVLELTDVLTITKNITAIRENEKKLNDTIDTLDKLSKRLEYKRSTLQDFNYIVSHNLRSPTGNLTALIDLHKRTSDSEKKELMLSKIFDVAAQLATTVHDLSQVLNINPNEELNVEQLRFDKVVENQLVNLAAQIMASGASVSYDFSACETILYPKVYLESVVLNLLTNSLKYASEKRKPIVHFTSAIDEFGGIRFTCTDNGQGIDLAKYGKKIFSLHKTFHNSPDARGVGLFITRNQIRSMGGNIAVDSEPDKGATFTIQFNETKLL